jgi:hypothetical protein
MNIVIGLIVLYGLIMLAYFTYAKWKFDKDE